MTSKASSATIPMTANMTNNIVLTGHRTVGVFNMRDDGQRLIFRSTDPGFAVLDGSTFANRHALQRAVERLASLEYRGMPSIGRAASSMPCTGRSDC